MRVEKSNIEGILIIESNKFKDNRGWFQESYNLRKFINSGIDMKFVQDNLVYSKKNVLRGLHFQKDGSQGKLVSCIKGRIFDVAVDLRQSSSTYKEWIGCFLSEDDNNAFDWTELTIDEFTTKVQERGTLGTSCLH